MMKGRFGRLFVRVFGIPEYHSHIRWNAVRRYIDFTAERTLEVGACTGVMTFEVAARNKSGQIIASEYDAAQVEVGQFLRQRSGIENVTFVRDDLRDLGVGADCAFDQVLAIDVLEHIDEDQEAVRQLANALRPGGRLVVSVPTPRYPEVMGRAYHESIGHVREGYWQEDLVALLSGAGFRVLKSHYHTGPLASFGCKMFYRSGLSRRFAMLFTPLFVAVGLAGERSLSRSSAAGLALVAERVVA